MRMPSCLKLHHCRCAVRPPLARPAAAVGLLFPPAATSVDVGFDPGATGLNVPLNVGPGPGWESCMEWMAAGNRLRPFFHVSFRSSTAAAAATTDRAAAPAWPCLPFCAWPALIFTQHTC